ncbi:hypothetical protein HDU98_004900, partial [Podochytrium sp. JEL0797]
MLQHLLARRLLPSMRFARTLSTAESAALAAFSARSGVALASPKALQVALTHVSYVAPSTSSSDSSDAPSTLSNDDASDLALRRGVLGQRLLAFHTTSWLQASYPRLPAAAVESLVHAFQGDKALASVGRSLGVQHVM